MGGCPATPRDFKNVSARRARGRAAADRRGTPGKKGAQQRQDTIHATCLPAARAACAARHSASMAGRSAACRISYVRAYGADASKTVGCKVGRREEWGGGGDKWRPPRDSREGLQRAPST